ncbi:MAG: Maf family nucleotide pyrophosphatase [Lactobacillales bacterium]|jgi:septum formation protein|nr:Maf family nucleotide pyrophosphatase [Lactobacillales bacterium]
MNNHENIWGLKKGFILASSSKQRLALLETAGFYPEKTVAADVDETPLPNELPKEYVRRIAISKASKVSKSHPGTFILAADTIIAVGRRIMMKAPDENAARRNLELLSGRGHKVYTGMCIITPDGRQISKTVISSVRIKALSPQDIDILIKSKEWVGVSGYYIDGILSAFVLDIKGSYPNIVGLPIYQVGQILRGVLS